MVIFSRNKRSKNSEKLSGETKSRFDDLFYGKIANFKSEPMVHFYRNTRLSGSYTNTPVEFGKKGWRITI